MRSKSLFTVAIVLVALAISTIRILRTPLSICELDPSMQNVSLYQDTLHLSALWQGLINNPYIGRITSLLLDAITLTLTYCFTRSLYGGKVASWTIFILGFLYSTNTLLRTNGIYSWIILLSVFSTFTFYLGIRDRKYLLLYIPAIMGLISIHFIGIALLLGHLSFPTIRRLKPSNGWFLFLCIALPSIVLIDGITERLILISVIAIPLAILFVYLASRLTLRVQIAGAVLLLTIGLSQPYTVIGQRIVKTINQQSQSNLSAFPILVDISSNCVSTNDIIDTIYNADLMSYIHDSRTNRWIAVNNREVNLLNELPDTILKSQGYWKIEDTQASNEIQNLLFQRDYETARLSLFYQGKPQDISPDTPPIYQLGGLLLLKFELLPGTEIEAGSTILVNSWWSSADLPLDDYILDMSLVDTTGQPVASDRGLLAKSYTQQWIPKTVYQDRRLLKVPETKVSGDYNLVISIHGTADASNVPVKLIDGTVVGDYGYLTTIHITQALNP